MNPTRPIPRFLFSSRGSGGGRTIFRPNAHPTTPNPLTSRRHTSTKPLVLEKPSKFRPPSHPARLVKNHTPQNYPGPPVSEAEKEAQEARRYPHTMPKKGTWIFLLLTSKALHVWFTFSVLTTLGLYASWVGYVHGSPFKHLLPSKKDIIFHPWSSLNQLMDMVILQTDYRTTWAQGLRRRGVEDVQKVAEYRDVHGLNEKDGMFGWTAKTEDERVGVQTIKVKDRPAILEQRRRAKKLQEEKERQEQEEKERQEQEQERRIRRAREMAEEKYKEKEKLKQKEADEVDMASPKAQMTALEEEDERTYNDFEGKQRPLKKWLGIW
ncbi:MAG: hypothetical protein M1834_002954 [Cirrosporium novae-zelandiae]|nr:MAG: hypothetical protein M1834_002954 [Cirrosporium novae-zelandiae]